ncbi:activin types I and II receptor domain protein, partial [Ostertagia ostertagi]
IYRIEAFDLSIPEEAVGNPYSHHVRLENVDDATRNLCFCNYGGDVCDSNNTCIKHTHAACFHFMKEVFNAELRRMETCNSFRSPHRTPRASRAVTRVITVTCESNLHQFYDDEWLQHKSHPALYVIVPLVIALCIIAGVCLLQYFQKRHAEFRKWLPLVNKQKNEKESPSTPELEPMVHDDSGSGSGSGNAAMVQRTVANDLIIEKIIGKGRYGEVRLARFRGSLVAVKTFYTTEEDSWNNEREIYETQMLNHENILQYVAADIFSMDSFTQMILHLHASVIGTGSRRKPQIAHRDIKSKNIIVKRPGMCCMADFGLAVRFEDRLIPEKVNVQVGTKRYMAPEVIRKTLDPNFFAQFKMADMYSYALVLWEIARKVEVSPNDQSVVGIRNSKTHGASSSQGAYWYENYSCSLLSLTLVTHRGRLDLLVFNAELRRMETVHQYGCALEKGSSASHLTCNSFRSPHRTPKSIACCYEGNYCNLRIEPPPYHQLPKEIEFYDDEWLQHKSHPALYVIVPLFVSFNISRNAMRSSGKWLPLVNKQKNEKESPSTPELEPMVHDDSGSGSGSGNAAMVQRTVANDLIIEKIIGKGRFDFITGCGGFLCDLIYCQVIIQDMEKSAWRGSEGVLLPSRLSIQLRKIHGTTSGRSTRRQLALNHENILQYVAADIFSMDSFTQMILVTDYHPLGSLYDYLQQEQSTRSAIKKALQLRLTRIIFFQAHILRVYPTPHTLPRDVGTGSRRKPQIAHRDIKSKNIIVKRPGMCCMADFGLAVR